MHIKTRQIANSIDVRQSQNGNNDGKIKPQVESAGSKTRCSTTNRQTKKTVSYMRTIPCENRKFLGYKFAPRKQEENAAERSNLRTQKIENQRFRRIVIIEFNPV